MRSFILLLVCIAICNKAFDQFLPAGYVKLKAEQFEENGEKYVGVYPTINTQPSDDLGKQVVKYHRRFEYLLNNKTHFQNLYDHLYPDTVKINALYIDSISKDKTFITYFNQLIQPLAGKEITRQTYTRQQMMKVASRFFYCNGVRDDTTVSSNICIVLNGVKEAQWESDFTILEAFCFEAIFENYYEKKDVRSGFVKNFLRYIKEGEQVGKSKFSNKETYLQIVRSYAFDRMENDEQLTTMLLKYYNDHLSTLSFRIQ